MKTILISLIDGVVESVESVIAEYYVMEDGWVTFKTSDHKAVAAYPERRVLRIKASPEEMPAAHQRRSLPA